jgi:hypothetical protein
MDEDSDGYLCVNRTKLRQDVHCNIVVTDDVVELETEELFSSLLWTRSVPVVDG